MKKYLILLIVPFMMMASCMEDTSAYLPQEKENVDVDAPSGGGEEPTPPTADELIPGIQAVTLSVKSADGTEMVRRFKYFMPVSIDKSKPISLILELHGSWEYEGEYAPNPIESIHITHSLNQHAIKENCIVVFPAGLPHKGSDKNYVNWTDTDNNLRFIDDIIGYFKGMKPLVDQNRIYSTGQSSGAIFSYVLAFERSEIFAAIAPRAGQMSLADKTIFPTTAVPVIAFNGVNDKTVSHSAAVTNIINWANKVGGYFPNDMQYNEKDTLEVPGYGKYLTRTWSGSKADIKFVSLLEEDHSVDLAKNLPMMWEFLSTHVRGSASTNLYLTASETELFADCGRKYDIELKYSGGAKITFEAPADWNASLVGDVLKVVTPTDFFTTAQEGSITIRAELNGITKSRIIPFTLNAPKTHFKFGDVYRNGEYEAIGVVVWVNPKNSREAAILNLQEVTTQGTYETINFGAFGRTFYTPDADNGENNTSLLMKQREDAGLQSSLTNKTSAVVWAAEYSYEGVSGWYLPSVNELAAIDKRLSEVNEIIKYVGGKELKPAKAIDGVYLSSTVLPNGTKGKEFKMFDFFKHTMTNQIVTNDNSSYYRARAMKKVKIN